MANLPELNQFDAGVYQIETSDPVLGGVDGITNVPLKALVNRTRWLKNQVDALAADVAAAIDADYVQGEINKLPFKAPVVAVTTTNITLSGLQTIDGVSLTAGQRVLVAAQSTAAQNGIYTAQTTAWVRADDMNADAEIQAGVQVMVTGGAIFADTIWHLLTDGTITIGTTAQTWKCLTNNTALLGNPTAPTAAQFDNDTTLANTEFVQRALGNDAGVVVVAANRTMTAADAGRYLFVNSNNLTFTLPDPATLPLGAKFRIAQGNLTSGGTIQAPGSVTIGNIQAGGTVTSVPIMQSTEYVLTVVSATAYQITTIGGAHSLTTNGWQRLPSGLIMQWMYVNAPTGAVTSFTLPITFPNQALLALSQVGVSIPTNQPASGADCSLTQFTLRVGGSTGSFQGHWCFAIGR